MGLLAHLEFTFSIEKAQIQKRGYIIFGADTAQPSLR